MTTEKSVRGRKPSGRTRDQIEREATKKHRKKLAENGKLAMQSYVSAETKDLTQKLKEIMELSTVGDVVEILVRQECKRRNIS